MPYLMFSLFAALLLGGCAADLKPEDDSPLDTRELPGPGGEHAHFSQNQGYYSARISSADGEWVYLDLDTQQEVYPAAPDNSAEWDIAHNGVEIKINGGVSGSPPQGEVRVYAHKVAPGVEYPWLALSGAPPAGEVEYRVDESGGLLGMSAQRVFTTFPEADARGGLLGQEGDHGWYHQSAVVEGGVISPRGNVAYIVRTLECRYVSLRFTDFTDQALSYDLRELPGSECASSGGDSAEDGHVQREDSVDGQRLMIDAEDENAWVYVDLGNAQQVQPQDAANDPVWDLAFRRSDVKMNGGVSGAAQVGLHDMPGADFVALTQPPDDAEYHQDEPDGLAFVTYPPADNTGDSACGGINGDHGWYYYSGFCNDGDGTHHISPRDVVYVLRDVDGASWKLRFLGYYDDAGNAAQLSVEFAPLAP